MGKPWWKAPPTKKTTPIDKPTAVQKLALSHFAPPNQMEALGGDVDLSSFIVQMRNKAGINVISEITDATVDRTIDGASTLTVTIDDAYKEVMNSGRLGRNVDVDIDGLWFTLVSVKKSQRTLNLTFEEREVNVLRHYSTFLMADRSTMTRAQFVLKMIQEVKEFQLDFCIPELYVVPPISDVQGPDQVAVDVNGNPLSSGSDSTSATVNRTGGIYTGVKGLTVRTAPATNEQITNANTVIRVGVEMKASRKVIVSAIMTAIDESNIRNLSHADSDPTPGTTSSGVFQQQKYINGKRTSWPASGDVATDAAGYYKVAISLDKSDPNLSSNDLCQGVQHSGTPLAYGAFEDEANKIVDAYGVAGAAPTAAAGTAAGQTSNNMVQTSNSVAGTAAPNGNYFTRGTLSQKNAQSTQTVLTKENSWNCMQRLAGEVDWVCFVISGTVYFVSESWLFKSRPFMSISEDSPGVDWIDYDYDEGKRVATVTVSCHLARWSAPPGSIVAIHDMGIVNGRWLVRDITRSLFDTQGTITLSKPRPVLPEPTSLTNLPSGFAGNDASSIVASTADQSVVVGTALDNVTNTQRLIVEYCISQLGVPYQYGAESPGVAFDCSGLSQAAYGSAGLSIERVAQNQYDAGPLRAGTLEPGDLLFFGTTGHIHHVAVYIGNGKMIEAPHTGANVRVATDFRSRDYYGATCPWTKASQQDTQNRQDAYHRRNKRG